jgi:hypothetical protein
MSEEKVQALEERISTLNTTVIKTEERLIALTDSLRREAQHLDEIMKLHQETHSREHDLTSGSIAKSEQTTNVKIGELEKRAELMRLEMQNLVTREYLERFVIQLDKVDTRVTTIEKVDTNSKENNQQWVSVGLLVAVTLVNIAIAVFSQIMT